MYLSLKLVYESSLEEAFPAKLIIEINPRPVPKCFDVCFVRSLPVRGI
jgi:hypothetical protein